MIYDLDQSLPLSTNESKQKKKRKLINVLSLKYLYEKIERRNFYSNLKYKLNFAGEEFSMFYE